MEREFRLSTASKISSAISSLIILVFGVKILMESPDSFFVFFALLSIALAVYLFVNDFFFRRIIVSDGTITFVGLFNRNEIFLSDIKGFRLGYRRMGIVDKDENVPRYNVYLYYQYDDFVNWLKLHFVDLDATDR
jgi:hypothetical protein